MTEIQDNTNVDIDVLEDYDLGGLMEYLSYDDLVELEQPQQSSKAQQSFTSIDDIFQVDPTVQTAETLGVGMGKRFSSNIPVMSDEMLQEMQDNHKEIIRLLVTGMKPRAVAIALDVHVNTVHNIKRSTLGRALSNHLHHNRDITVSKSVERMEGLSPLALDVYEEILTNDFVDTKLKKDTAKDVLKGSGVMIDRKHVITDNPYITAEEAADLKKRYKRTFEHEIENAIVVSESEAEPESNNNSNSLTQMENL